MWTIWIGPGCARVELHESLTPEGLALELVVVEGWAIWMLEDGRVLRVVAAARA